MIERTTLSPDRFFSAEPMQRKVARQLYDSVLNLPILCPCLEPCAWKGIDRDEEADPCELLLLADDYFVRHMTGLGIDLGNAVPGSNSEKTLPNRKIWQAFADHLNTLRGLPSDVWLSDVLLSVFNIKEKLNSKNAGRMYDAISDCLRQPEFKFSRLVERFNIECLGLLESPTNPAINVSQAAQGNVRTIPCFNPDLLFRFDLPDWRRHIDQLSGACQIPITDFPSFCKALQKQRQFFKSLGATTVVQTIYSSEPEAIHPIDLEVLFSDALNQKADLQFAHVFSNRMLLLMAEMSTEDSLVLQVNSQNEDSRSNHNHDHSMVSTGLMDLPGFKALVERFGCNPHLNIVVPVIDLFKPEDQRKLAEEYHSFKLSTPLRLFSSLSSIQFYFSNHLEITGLHKFAGLNSRLCSFFALPAQHDIWRRACANWLAGLVTHGLLDLENAYEMIYALAYGQVKSIYKL